MIEIVRAWAPRLREPALFGLAGLLNTGIDLAFFWILTDAGVPALAANVASFAIGAINSYLLNALVTFRGRGAAAAGIFNAGRAMNFMAVTFLSLAISTVALALALTALNPLSAKLVSLLLTFAVNYLLVSRFVFVPRIGGGSALLASLGCPDERALVPASLVFLALLLAVLVTLTPVPPLFDYANHLVRMWLVAGGANESSLSSMYRIDWSAALTNVGIDYLAALLGRAMPANVLGSGLLWLAMALPPLGVALFNRAIFGGWRGWQIAAFSLAWPATLIAGFLNFQIGLGFALLAAACHERIQSLSLPVRFAVQVGIACALLLVHVFALFFYCALVSGLALGSRAPRLSSRTWILAASGRVLMQILPLAAPLAAMTLLAPRLPGAHTDAAGNAPVWNLSLYEKAITLLTPFSTYMLSVDLLFLGAVSAPLIWAILAGRIAAHAGLLWVAGALALLGIASPTAIAGTWWIDNRFPVMAALALFAALQPEPARERSGRAIMAGFLVLIITARAVWIAGVWHMGAADVASVRRAVADVPFGSVILPLDNRFEAAPQSCMSIARNFHNGHPTYWSYPVLAIMWRKAFVPNIFWAAGKQPLAVIAPWNEISIPEDALHPISVLGDSTHLPAHFRDWRRRYDHVLLLNADCPNTDDRLLGGALVLLKNEGFARLYLIVRP